MHFSGYNDGLAQTMGLWPAAVCMPPSHMDKCANTIANSNARTGQARKMAHIEYNHTLHTRHTSRIHCSSVRAQVPLTPAQFSFLPHHHCITLVGQSRSMKKPILSMAAAPLLQRHTSPAAAHPPAPLPPYHHLCSSRTGWPTARGLTHCSRSSWLHTPCSTSGCMAASIWPGAPCSPSPSAGPAASSSPAAS